MNGRCATQGRGNLVDLDVYIRDNKHKYNAFVYGLKQNKVIDVEIPMSAEAELFLKKIFYLSAQSDNSLTINDIKLMVDKATSMKTESDLNTLVSFTVDKQVRTQSLLEMSLEVKAFVLKIIQGHLTGMSLDFEMMLKMLYFLNANIQSTLDAEIVKLWIDKYVSLTSESSLQPDISLLIDKWFYMQSENLLDTGVVPLIRKILNTHQTDMAFDAELRVVLQKLVNTQIQQTMEISDVCLNIDKYITNASTSAMIVDFYAFIDKLTQMQSISNFNTDALLSCIKALKNQEPQMSLDTVLRAGLTKLTTIADVQDLFISDIQDKLISELYQTKIY